MKLSVVSIGPMLAVLFAGCVAGVQSTDKSADQKASERSISEAIFPPPMESQSAEGITSRLYGYERRVGNVTERKPPVPKGSYTEGFITAVTYREITDRISLVVDLYDDSDINRMILDHMLRSLSDAEHTIGGYPLFELSFSSHFHSPVYFNKGPDLGSASFGLGLKPSKLDMNVWSSTHDSLVTGRRRRSYKTGQYDFEIHASLRERSLGEVVWEGRAVAYVERGKAADMVPSMVDALVSNLGRSVRGGRFRLK